MPAPVASVTARWRVGFLADVAADEAAADLARDRCAALVLQVGNDDRCAMGSQHARRAFAEAGRAAGDDEYLALDLHLELLQPSAASARAVISSTLPVPLILRYAGASGSPEAAQRW